MSTKNYNVDSEEDCINKKCLNRWKSVLYFINVIQSGLVKAIPESNKIINFLKNELGTEKCESPDACIVEARDLLSITHCRDDLVDMTRDLNSIKTEASEIYRRVKKKKDLIGWCNYFDPEYHNYNNKVQALFNLNWFMYTTYQGLFEKYSGKFELEKMPDYENENKDLTKNIRCELVIDVYSIENPENTSTIKVESKEKTRDLALNKAKETLSYEIPEGFEICRSDWSFEYNWWDVNSKKKHGSESKIDVPKFANKPRSYHLHCACEALAGGTCACPMVNIFLLAGNEPEHIIRKDAQRKANEECSSYGRLRCIAKHCGSLRRIG